MKGPRTDLWGTPRVIFLLISNKIQFFELINQHVNKHKNFHQMLDIRGCVKVPHGRFLAQFIKLASSMNSWVNKYDFGESSGYYGTFYWKKKFYVNFFLLCVQKWPLKSTFGLFGAYLGVPVSIFWLKVVANIMLVYNWNEDPGHCK